MKRTKGLFRWKKFSTAPISTKKCGAEKGFPPFQQGFQQNFCGKLRFSSPPFPRTPNLPLTYQEVGFDFGFGFGFGILRYSSVYVRILTYTKVYARMSR